MRLPTFLQRKSASGAHRAPIDEGTAQQERARARRRLIGAVVLVLIGVVGLPMIFDRAPRPLAVDIAIDIPRKDNVPPLPVPPASRAARKDAAPVAESPAEPVPAVVAPTPAAKPADPPVTASAADKPAAKASDAAAEASRARAALEGRAAPAKPTAKDMPKPEAVESAGRFVVQVGAFSETDSAREARSRVEKLGFKTYTQTVDTANGKRIRVRIGPYADRAEADRVALQIKQAGIASAVLGL